MSIELSKLKPQVGSRRKFKRFGRGNASGRGTTAGKGTKGQRARQGGRKGLRQLGMKWATQSTPKLAGFASIHSKAAVLPVNILNKFADGSTLTVSTFAGKGLVPKQTESIKIVGDKKVTRKIKLAGIAVSAGAKKQIEAAGGSVV
jgi:large subunit ribosomal protein L15